MQYSQTSGTGCAALPAKPENQEISQEINSIEGSLKLVQERFAQLTQRLDAILQPPIPSSSDCGKAMQSSPESPIGNRLRAIVHQIGNLSEGLDYLTSRVRV